MIQYVLMVSEYYPKTHIKAGSNPEWNCDVWHFNGGIAVGTIVKRCTIHDAIIYALDGAML